MVLVFRHIDVEHGIGQQLVALSATVTKKELPQLSGLPQRDTYFLT